MSSAIPLANATALWQPYEAVAHSWNELREHIDAIAEAYPARAFAWRGVGDASYPLNSSLYRRLWWTNAQKTGSGDPPTELHLREAEDRVIVEAREWGLHSGARGRLSALELLATLQHYGVPTRLIDISFNPLIGAFFSLGDSDTHAGVDARLFAVDVTGNILDEGDEWVESPALPWRKPYPDWGQRVRVWRPAAFDRRIAAQQGGFLIGGVPGKAADRRAWPKDPANARVRWRQSEMRAALPIAARVYKLGKRAGADPQGQALFSIRIARAAKPSIRDVLRKRYALDHATLFGDFYGLASYGVGWLVTRPP